MQITTNLFFQAAATATRTATSGSVARFSAPAPTTATPADSYRAGAKAENLGIFTPQQALAMKAQNAKPAYTDKDLMASIASHDYSKMVEQMANMPKKREFVAQFHRNHPEEYKALVADIRAGKVTSPSLKVAVGLDTLNGTEWAKTREGARVAAHLGKLYDTGKLSSEENPGGLGRTDAIGQGTGMNGDKVDSRVILRDDLLNSPEAMATVMAHEGQHSYRNASGTKQRSLKEEVDAHTAQNAVWAELGKEKNAAGAEAAISSLDATAKLNTEEKLYNRLATTYVQDYIDKGDKAAARGMINDYVAYSGAHNISPVTNMPGSDLETLKKNAQSLVGAKSSKEFLNSVDELQAAYANREMAGTL